MTKLPADLSGKELVKRSALCSNVNKAATWFFGESRRSLAWRFRTIAVYASELYGRFSMRRGLRSNN